MKTVEEIQNIINKIRAQLHAETLTQHQQLRNVLALTADNIDKVADAALEPTLEELFDFANACQNQLAQAVAVVAEFKMRKRNTERALAAVDPQPTPSPAIAFDGTKRQSKLKAIGV